MFSVPDAMGRKRATDRPLPGYAITIREARKRMGYRSQDDLATAIGSKQQTVAGWESGRGPPKRDMVPILAATLNVPPAALIPAEFRGLEEPAGPLSTQAEVDRLFATLTDSIARALRLVGAEPSAAALARYARSIWRLCGGTDTVAADLGVAQAHISALQDLWRDLHRRPGDTNN